jgi:hypothetical protein
MHIEVAHAGPDKKLWLDLEVPEGCTVREAIARSGLMDHFPELDLEAAPVGVFGKLTRLDATVSEGDRVEIYRPALAERAS